MKRIASIMLGLGLTFGTAAVFAQAPAQTDQPKTEKAAKPKAKSKADEKTEKGKGKTKSGKKKAEEPKQQ